MKTYWAEIRPKGTLFERLRIEAPHRGKAVHKTQLYFWKRYKGRLGPAHKAVTVNDPCGEVHYSQTFNCADNKMNRLLPEEIILRVIAESRGELVRDDSAWTPHVSPGSVRRVKRRRDFGRFIAPGVRAIRNGRLYYRLNAVSQIVHDGRRYRKRKYQDVPLVARTLSEVVEEIKTRGLAEQNALQCRRTMKCRTLKILEHVAGITTLSLHALRRYRKIVAKYQCSTPAP